MTGQHHSASQVRLDVDSDARALAQVSPTVLLQGAAPRLIDEWQLEPHLWNHLRHEVDDRRVPGQFILTGSSTPVDDVTRHSGAGRIVRLRMRPMSLYESGHSSAAVSLDAIISGEPPPAAQSGMALEDLVKRLCVGGWPALQNLSCEDAQFVLRSYLDDVARVDIQVAGASATRRDPERVRRMLDSYARHIATSASIATIAKDTGGEVDVQLYSDTVREYLAALQRIWVVEEQPSWAPHLRSRDIVRKAAVRHFVDPSLAAAALGAGPERLLWDPNTLGLLFESMVVRDLRVYAQALDGEVRHYRDSAGAEADAVLQLRDGRWAVIEVKLASSQVDAAAASLTALVNKIDTSRIGKPAARIVITAGRYAYTRPDGVHVVPLACLGP